MSVNEQLERILKSPPLVSSPSLCRFLRYVVEETLAGRDAGIKEHHLGVRVFDRGDDFSPRLDPIVRVQARNLRTRIARYYEGEGAADPIRIELPKGTYVPVFHHLIPDTPETGEERSGEPSQVAATAAAVWQPATRVDAPQAALVARPAVPVTAQVQVPGSALSTAVSMPASVMPVPPPRSPVAESRQHVRVRFLLATVVLVVILAGIAVLWITRTYAAPPRYGFTGAGPADFADVICWTGRSRASILSFGTGEVGPAEGERAGGEGDGSALSPALCVALRFRQGIAGSGRRRPGAESLRRGVPPAIERQDFSPPYQCLLRARYAAVSIFDR